MPGPVRLSGKLICASAARSAVIERYLPEHIRLTRAEPGCLAFDVTPTADPLIWNVEEVFVDRAAFEAHQARAKSSEWARQTSDIRRDYTITEVDHS